MKTRPTIRLLVTLFLPLIAWAAERVMLPGLNYYELRGGFTRMDTTSFSVVALGIMPVISAFILVEIFALVVPRWRGLRTGGPEGRRALRRAAVALTIALAAVQAWFIALWFSQTSHLLQEPGLKSRLVIVTSLVAGTCFLLALAWLNDRYGLGNGLSILFAAGILRSVIGYGSVWVRAFALNDATPGSLLMAVLGTGAIVYATHFLLTAHRRTPLDSPLIAVRQPTSGFVPIVWAASILMIPQQLEAYGMHPGFMFVPSSLRYLIIDAALVVAIGYVLSALFNRTDVIASVIERVAGTSDATIEPRVKTMVRAATKRTVFFLAGLCLVVYVLNKGQPFTVDYALFVVLVAVVMDLAGEWRARSEHPDLVVVWPLHRVALIEPALTALREAGIFAYARSAYHRSLLQFFGPYIPADILAPEARAEEAQQVLRRALD